MKVEKVMHEYKHGELKSGKGGKGGNVKSRKQAIANWTKRSETSRSKSSEGKKLIKK